MEAGPQQVLLGCDALDANYDAQLFVAYLAEFNELLEFADRQQADE